MRREIDVDIYEENGFEFYFFYEKFKVDVFALEKGAKHFSYFRIDLPPPSEVYTIRGVIAVKPVANRFNKVLNHIINKLKIEEVLPQKPKTPINIKISSLDRQFLVTISDWYEGKKVAGALAFLFDKFIFLKIQCEGSTLFTYKVGEIKPKDSPFTYVELSAICDDKNLLNVMIERMRLKIIEFGHMDEKHKFVF